MTLTERSREFASEQGATGGRLLVTTILVLIGAFAAALLLPAPVSAAAAVVAGLTLVRLFIFFHDFQHHAIFSRQPALRIVFTLIGWLVLTPTTVWIRTHNYHHAHNAELAPFTLGSFLVLSTEQYRRLSWPRCLRYRIERSPLNILAAPVTVFLFGMLVMPLIANWRRHAEALWVLIGHAALIALALRLGTHVLVFGYLIPLWVATTVGAALFFLQHNAPGVWMFARGERDFERSAIDASTFLDGGPLFHWFTGNIGYHHIHHLNPKIPFYRLAEANAALAPAERTIRIRVTPASVHRCFRCFLWSPDHHRFITRAEYHRLSAQVP